MNAVLAAAALALIFAAPFGIAALFGAFDPRDDDRGTRRIATRHSIEQADIRIAMGRRP